MTWRDEQYFRRWEQEILEKLRNIDPSSYCNEIKPSEEDFAPKTIISGMVLGWILTFFLKAFWHEKWTSNEKVGFLSNLDFC